MWYYNEKPFTLNEQLEKHIGFVYVIEDLSNGKKYVGKKKLESKRRIAPLKGKIRKRIVIKESDWMDYYGSSEEVKAAVEKLGFDNFRRTIIRLCKTTAEMSYYEMKFQVENDVLLKPDEWYNAFVGGKIHRSHLKHLQIPKVV